MNDNEAIMDIVAMLRANARGDRFDDFSFTSLADRLEAAHKRERGDCAKLREALKHIKDRLPHMLQYMRVHWEDASAGGYFDELMLVIDAALAAPPRNCDKVKDHSDAIGKFEKWMDFSPKTADEQDTFFKEHWFEFAMWLIDMNESEVADGSK